jgi:hypothetical protein
MCTPTAEAINPRYFDYQPRGWANENYGHNPYDAPTTPVPTPHFDWGVGTALAAFAEARNRFGDVWVDLARHAAYGIDDVAVTRLRVGERLLELELESRTAGHRVLVRADGMRAPSVHLRINGTDIGEMTRAQLCAGVPVPTHFRGRVVHNPCRVAPPRAGADLRLTAHVTEGTDVAQAAVTYRFAGGWHTEVMTVTSGGKLVGTIPGGAITPGAVIEYYLTAQTTGGPVWTPEVDPEQVPFRLTVG